MHDDIAFSLAHIALILLSLVLFVVSARAPTISRLALVALFAIGGGAVLTAAIAAPTALLDVARYGSLAAYRHFVETRVASHPTVSGLALAAFLLLLAAALVAGGRSGRWAVWAGIIALVVVVPFGAGTAFPAPLFLAAALWLTGRCPGLLDEPAIPVARLRRHAHAR